MSTRINQNQFIEIFGEEFHETMKNFISEQAIKYIVEEGVEPHEEIIGTIGTKNVPMLDGATTNLMVNYSAELYHGLLAAKITDAIIFDELDDEVLDAANEVRNILKLNEKK
jgi:hypothetical protein